ncbi:MAG: hypothetical protein L0H79_21755 [Intrasporangium sp.]|uniref:hypothetical protein n=1 Tax=Intrasporangium sp. TaxID=1925024 RepID=UPI0026496D51|nr:hypothetical protein [Intrasporangium sp.]MDN5798353.1 hypothetical protein [Intrasporangium sp.]
MAGTALPPGPPAQLLALQRLAGNQAVSRLLTQPEPTVQRLATMTGLKSEHAQKVLKNHLKGDPPFKPQRGNFGEVSWFAGSGNPYVGGQAQSYDVTIDVVINPDPVKLPATYFADFVRQYVRQTRADLDDPSTHHNFWVALGRALETGGAQEVPIDRSAVSKQGGGTFVVVGGSARESIRLGNAAKLSQDLGGSAATTAQVIERRRTTRAAWFTVVFDRVPPDQAQAGAPQRALVLHVTPPASFSKAEKTFPAMGWGDKKVPASVSVTFTLTYADYSIARRQAKRLATAIGDGRLAGHRVALAGGTGWSGKETRSYRS